MDFIKIKSFLCSGIQRQELSIEVLRSRGLSQILLTGLPDAWLRDSRDKIRAVVAQHSSWDTLDRILVHILPPELNKNGAHLELPIALGCMAALNKEKLKEQSLKLLEHYHFIGSLSLEGNIIPTTMTEMLEKIPDENVLGPADFRNLSECWNFVLKGERLTKQVSTPRSQEIISAESDVTLVNRQAEEAWIATAAIAEVPVLMLGPPGSGKSTLARWASNLLPLPEGAQLFEVQQIWSLAQSKLNFFPPVIMPHSRSHLSEYIGTGKEGKTRPGYFSLAHGGLLILDELAEMNRDCREILRVILDQKVVIRNTGQQLNSWPASFWLIATSNPCPCGKSQNEITSKCKCTVAVRKAYQSRISGPLMDRFALRLFVSKDRPANEHSHFGESSFLSMDKKDMRTAVANARPEARSSLDECRRLIASNCNFERLSERDQSNKARLLSAMRFVLPHFNSREHMAILSIQSSLESSLYLENHAAAPY